jgi:hypothetical protein
VAIEPNVGDDIHDRIRFKSGSTESRTSPLDTDNAPGFCQRLSTRQKASISSSALK